MKPDKIFVVVQPGLEDVAEMEIRTLGYNNLERIKGGIFLYGHMNTVMKLNNACRCISRVLIEIAEFEAKTFFQLEKHFNQIQWQNYITQQQACIRVSSFQSSLYHEKAISERLINSLCCILGKPITVVGSPNENNVQLIVIYVKHDKFIVRMDTSGTHLHKRGYGICKEDAPLRETIACAMLYAINWNQNSFSLYDPMCGSGTIAIEAALMAMKMPWFVYREFAFQRWSCFDQNMYDKVKENLRKDIQPNLQVNITASDIYDKAIVSAKINAHKANVEHMIIFKQLSLKDCSFNRDDIILTNPPWGIRLLQSGTIDYIVELKRIHKQVKGIYAILPDGMLDQSVFNPKPLLSLKSGNIKVSMTQID